MDGTDDMADLNFVLVQYLARDDLEILRYGSSTGSVGSRPASSRRAVSASADLRVRA
ncbi:hypothetical protein [Allobaculum sp. Allo2]|uniref:hypothetical protein n=1 Tax=Allobaculum sp. Allo2 TaxID=2853432 RepID=UPI001F618574|nr:hypothetical protein [Allobaculum sp. Allo2]UNT93842.1 hypothetical protein KWG61_03740 [Allobaculum sp. Allo2]